MPLNVQHHSFIQLSGCWCMAWTMSANKCANASSYPVAISHQYHNGCVVLSQERKVQEKAHACCILHSRSIARFRVWMITRPPANLINHTPGIRWRCFDTQTGIGIFRFVLNLHNKNPNSATLMIPTMAFGTSRAGRVFVEVLQNWS